MGAKSLQSFRLCKPRDCNPAVSSVHGILQTRILGHHDLLQGIFPTQGSNLCLLRLLCWQAGSLSPVPPGKPCLVYTHHKKCIYTQTRTTLLRPWVGEYGPQGFWLFGLCCLWLVLLSSILPSHYIIWIHYAEVLRELLSCEDCVNIPSPASSMELGIE